MNNVLTKNLLLLFKVISYNGNLFHSIKVRPNRNDEYNVNININDIYVLFRGTDYQKIRNITKMNNFKTILKSFMILIINFKVLYNFNFSVLWFTFC